MISRATRAIIPATLLVGLASSLFTAPASAGADFAAESLASSWQFSQPIQRIQYFTLNGDEYCWYGDGWKGPGWYLCGDQWNYDFGWGGAMVGTAGAEAASERAAPIASASGIRVARTSLAARLFACPLPFSWSLASLAAATACGILPAI